MASSSKDEEASNRKPYLLSICWTSQLDKLLSDYFTIFKVEDIEKKIVSREDIIAATISPGSRNAEIEKNIDLYSNLKVVASYGVGIDHVDLKLMKSHGIKVSNTPGVVNDSTADLAITLMLASARNIFFGREIAMDKEKGLTKRHFELGLDVCYSSIGIVGMGSIGFEVARRAKAFKMTIYYHNRNKRSIEDENEVDATYCDKLHDMLPLCDFVVITCPLKPETKNLISTPEFNVMKQTAILVNVARGGIVDHDALYDALSTNRIRSAALDVTEPEPLPDGHKLLSLSNIIILPHIGTAAIQTRHRMQDLLLENLLAGVSERPLPSEVKI